MHFQCPWIGPMPVRDFLSRFLSTYPFLPAPNLSTVFQEIMPYQSQEDMQRTFIQIIEEFRLIPGFKIEDHASYAEDCTRNGLKFRPDPCLYREEAASKGAVQFDKMQLHFAMRWGPCCDAFQDPPPDMPHTQRALTSFKSSTPCGSDLRRHLVFYASEWFAHQFRVFGFSVLVAYPYARFIRWDRAAAIVSEAFDLHEDAQPLIDFLWLFSHLKPRERGVDDTVRPATFEEERLAREHLWRWKNAFERPVVVYKIQGDGWEREFISWGAMADPDALIGRATRAYPVHEKATGRTFFLKDSWVETALLREASILHELNCHQVRNVPLLICGGDIHNHWTWSYLYRDLPWVSGSVVAVARIHHRFVEDVIGLPLHRFSSLRHLMRVILDALIAHQEAYEKCGIIHHDISSTNVMMTPDGHGVLNDWDLAMRYPPYTGDERLSRSRMGTLQFMSANTLRYNGKRHLIQDDIESFIYLTLYFALRYLRHTESYRTPKLIADVFDSSFDPMDGGPCGGGLEKWWLWQAPAHALGQDFRFTDSRALSYWFEFVRTAVKQWHGYEDHVMGLRESMLRGKQLPFRIIPADHARTLILANHQRLRDVWEYLLSLPDWPKHELILDGLSPNPFRKEPSVPFLGSYASPHTANAQPVPSEVVKMDSAAVDEGDRKADKRIRPHLSPTRSISPVPGQVGVLEALDL